MKILKKKKKKKKKTVSGSRSFNLKICIPYKRRINTFILLLCFQFSTIQRLLLCLSIH
ncbi:hypothetical protein HanRHA438_Chr15g0711981 [Helianthus annuus]|nr:hypothetical protein HanRHA438_Chr15g0711981 [Helianthus annuus]